MSQVSPGSGARVGVDIGGTFTDIVVCRPDGTVLVSKVPSTPEDPAAAVVQGVAALLSESGLAPADVVEVIHGTTVASNTILQRTGARTGLLTTRGFRDILEIGRIRTPDLYDLTWDKPVPLVERRWRLEVDERITAQGEVLRPLDGSTVLESADRLVRDGIESLAICFLHSHVAPAHEEEAARLVRERHPRLDLSLSCRVLPEIREYERTSTTVVNAYLLPTMRRYLSNLAAGLEGIGVRAPLLVVASNGGVMSAPAAAERPVFVVGSGPAAGVAGAARLGASSGIPDLIAFDMGGTTAKASLVEAGQVVLTSEYEFRDGISTPSRFIKAGGYMLKAPAIDVAEVGAGAGSTAWIDPGGLLRVGPQSAGAVPGPACYAQGGDRPTVTDANVVLGYLNPTQLAGGTLRLDAARARAAIERDLAVPLGLPTVDAARGIREVANANMARSLRAVTIERGRDPRDFALVAFGGSGPVHATDLAEILDIPRVVVPISPGVFTAIGMLTSDVTHHLVRAHACPLTALVPKALQAAVDTLLDEARSLLRAEGYDGDDMRLDVRADLRYVGQASELSIPLPVGPAGDGVAAALAHGFSQEYAATYGHLADDEIEMVNLRVVGTGIRRERLDFGRLRLRSRMGEAAPGTRQVWFGRGPTPVPTAILARDAIRADPRPGPIIVESYDSTVVVSPGWRVSADPAGSLILARRAA